MVWQIHHVRRLVYKIISFATKNIACRVRLDGGRCNIGDVTPDEGCSRQRCHPPFSAFLVLGSKKTPEIFDLRERARAPGEIRCQSLLIVFTSVARPARSSRAEQRCNFWVYERHWLRRPTTRTPWRLTPTLSLAARRSKIYNYAARTPEWMHFFSTVLYDTSPAITPMKVNGLAGWIIRARIEITSPAHNLFATSYINRGASH